MYAPRVFVSMIGVLLAFAVACYFITGSVYTSFIQTVICAVLLQVGYFIGVLYLVRRERNQTAEVQAARPVKDTARHDGMRTDAATNLHIGDH